MSDAPEEIDALNAAVRAVNAARATTVLPKYDELIASALQRLATIGRFRHRAASVLALIAEAGGAVYAGVHDSLDSLLGQPSSRLVVYGTLAPERPNHHLVADIPGEWFTGWVEGDFHQHGWGAAAGFPAMTWRPGGGRIDVHVLESAELRQHWPRLDEFEGAAYVRAFIPVFRDAAPPIIGQIYEARLARPDAM